MQGSIRICFFNEMEHQPGAEVSSHRHGCYELIYYHSGEGSVSIGDASFPYCAGTFTIIPPMTWHTESHTTHCRLSFIGFICGDELSHICGVHSDIEAHPTADLMRCFFEEVRGKAYGYEALLSDIVRKILIMTFRRTTTVPNVSTDRILYAVNYINEYFNTRIDMKQLAAMCGYGYDYFHHLFRNRTGVSPTNYLIRRRLLSAAKLLCEGVSCTDAAYRCGFSNSSQFSRMFRSQYGFPPSEITRRGFDITADEYLDKDTDSYPKPR